MAQYQTGTVAVVNGDPVVVGTGVDWSAISINARFYVAGDSRDYDIIDIDSVNNEITLGAPYQGSDDPVAAYALSLDFTPNWNLPIPYAGDIGLRPLWRRMVGIIDGVLGTGGGPGGGAVTTVFGRVGAIVATVGDYTLAQISDTATYVKMLATERTKLTSIAAGAQVNRTRSSQVEAEAGVDNTTDMSPLRTAQAIAAQAGGGPGVSDTFGAITPESQGAIGDGVTDDAAAFNAAYALAMSTGKLLRGNPAKVYRIATSLNDITTTIRISDVTFKAPNSVRLIRSNPTWTAHNTTLSALTTTNINGTTVTRVLLTNTTGISVGSWVSVGSSSVLWPGEVNTRWFEVAQVVAVNTNVSIDLHRRLIGEESSLLNANLRLFVIPNYRVELTRIRLIADGNPATTGQTGRQYGIELRGGIGHTLVDCRADSWWERFIRLSSAVGCSIVRPSWDYLPDIPASNEAFGYGIQEAGACYGNLTIGIQGGRCRHGYTSGGVNVASYDGSVPWNYGFVVNSAVKSSIVHGADGDCFDTHAGTCGILFDGCTSEDPVNQPNGLNLPSGFQNRGYRTRVINCTSRGGDTGFRDGSSLTDWGGLDPNIVEYRGIHVSEFDQDGIILEGAAGITNTTVIVDGLLCTNGNIGVHIDLTNRFDGSLLLNNFVHSELVGNGILDNSGRARVQVVGWSARYTGQSSAANPVKITAVATGSWLFDDVLILRRSPTSPLGFIEVAVVAAAPVQLGSLKWDLGDLPTLASSSTGTLTLSVLGGVGVSGFDFGTLT